MAGPHPFLQAQGRSFLLTFPASEKLHFLVYSPFSIFTVGQLASCISQAI
jgi:hypothetical protein